MDKIPEEKKIIIQEMNKVIAAFDGWIIDEQSRYCHKGDSVIVGINFRYDRSWKNLMNIVEKIEQGNFGFKMCRKVVEVYFDDSKEIILKVKESSRRESLFKAIHDFIIWYNKQKP
jgi:hypothetical protein